MFYYLFENCNEELVGGTGQMIDISDFYSTHTDHMRIVRMFNGKFPSEWDNFNEIKLSQSTSTSNLVSQESDELNELVVGNLSTENNLVHVKKEMQAQHEPIEPPTSDVPNTFELPAVPAESPNTQPSLVVSEPPTRDG